MAAHDGRKTLAFMVIVFGAPFVAAWLFALRPEFLPSAHDNHGRFITPPVTTSLKGAWTLLVPSTDTCDADCQRAENVAKVVRRALGAEAFQRVEGPLDCTSAQTRAACALLSRSVGAGATLVVIDPMGNAMMRYGPELAPRELLKDMRRLLKASKHWSHDRA